MNGEEYWVHPVPDVRTKQAGPTAGSVLDVYSVCSCYICYLKRKKMKETDG